MWTWEKLKTKASKGVPGKYQVTETGSKYFTTRQNDFKKGRNIITKYSVHQKDKIILNLYACKYIALKHSMIERFLINYHHGKRF